MEPTTLSELHLYLHSNLNLPLDMYTPIIMEFTFKYGIYL